MKRACLLLVIYTYADVAQWQETGNAGSNPAISTKGELFEVEKGTVTTTP